MKAKIIQYNLDDMVVNSWIAEGENEEELQGDIWNIIKGHDEVGPLFFDVGDTIKIFSYPETVKKDTWFYQCHNCRTITDTGETKQKVCLDCGEKVTSQIN